MWEEDDVAINIFSNALDLEVDEVLGSKDATNYQVSLSVGVSTKLSKFVCSSLELERHFSRNLKHLCCRSYDREEHYEMIIACCT